MTAAEGSLLLRRDHLDSPCRGVRGVPEERARRAGCRAVEAGPLGCTGEEGEKRDADAAQAEGAEAEQEDTMEAASFQVTQTRRAPESGSPQISMKGQSVRAHVLG
jgi:hypothetical protein